MIKGQYVIAIIPARGGSKGVPRKNIKLLAGKPLIFHTINEARKSKYLDKVVVSTEDDEIARISLQYGAEIVNRPTELAQDNSTSPDVLIHALHYVEQKEQVIPQIIVMLQATTPLRTAKDIDGALELFASKNPDSVTSVCKAPSKCNPHWVRKIEDGLLKPYLKEDIKTPHLMRQELPEVYWRNGMIYIVKKEVLLKTRNLYGDICIPYVMESDYLINIDEPIDFMLAELLVEKGLIKLND